MENENKEEKGVLAFNKMVEVEIGSYIFYAYLVNPKEIEGSDGILIHNDRTIKIRNDLDIVGIRLVLRHELVHAILLTQGRVYQKKFDLEEMCEFISYQLPEIERLTQHILDGLFGHTKTTIPYDDYREFEFKK